MSNTGKQQAPTWRAGCLVAFGFIYVLIGVFYSPAGFILEIVRDKAGKQLYRDQVYEVERAYITTNENLRVCAEGIFEQSPGSFWIFMPLRRIIAEPDKLDGIKGYKSYWRDATSERHWHLPRKVLRGDTCERDWGDLDRELPHAVIQGGMPASFKTLMLMDSAFADSSEQEIVFDIKTTGGDGSPLKHRQIAYMSRDHLFGSPAAHGITFSFIPYSVDGDKRWWWTAPLAWLADVLTWPIQLAMWWEYADAH